MRLKGGPHRIVPIAFYKRKGRLKSSYQRQLPNTEEVDRQLRLTIYFTARLMIDSLAQESWYEKLNRWDEALDAYTKKYKASQPGSAAHLEAMLGRLRCALQS